MLDFTQVRQGGGLPIARAQTDLHTVVSQVVEEEQLRTPQREIRIETVGDAHGAWDADRVTQAVGNLLSNALRYGAPGTPVRVTCRGEGSSVGIRVHNWGPAIGPEVMATVFEAMKRGQPRGGNSGRSVGLGLYIVKQIAAAHGGDVTVRSSLEQGTSFTLVLPR